MTHTRINRPVHAWFCASINGQLKCEVIFCYWPQLCLLYLCMIWSAHDYTMPYMLIFCFSTPDCELQIKSQPVGLQICVANYKHGEWIAHICVSTHIHLLSFICIDCPLGTLSVLCAYPMSGRSRICSCRQSLYVCKTVFIKFKHKNVMSMHAQYGWGIKPCSSRDAVLTYTMVAMWCSTWSFSNRCL